MGNAKVLMPGDSGVNDPACGVREVDSNPSSVDFGLFIMGVTLYPVDICLECLHPMMWVPLSCFVMSLHLSVAAERAQPCPARSCGEPTPALSFTDASEGTGSHKTLYKLDPSPLGHYGRLIG